MAVDYLKELGSGLIEQGYPIVPIKPGYKYPKDLKHWETISATHEDVKRWSNNGFKGGGVGILCGHVVPVDIDIRDKEVAQKMVDWCLLHLGFAPQRVGLAPKTMFVFRTDDPFTKLQSKTYSDFFGEEHKVEVLGQGQQFVAYAVHPDTGKPYKWIDGPGISDIPFDELPEITREQAQEFIDYFEEIRPREWEKVLRGASKFNGTAAPVKDEWDSIVPKVNISKEDALKALNIIAEYADDRDTWINVGKAIHHQFSGSDEGLEIFDEWSQHSSKYGDGRDGLPKDKWKGFYSVPRGKRPVTFAYVLKLKKDVVSRDKRAEQVEKIKEARDCGGSHSANDNNELSDLNEDASDLDVFLKRYIFVEEGRLVCDLTKKPQKCLSRIEEFRDQTANVRHEIPAPTKTEPDKMKVVPVHNSWMVHPDRMSTQGPGYMPGANRIFEDEDDGLSYVNTFYMPEFKKEDVFFGDIDLFLKHMHYLFPIETEREWFIDWMAFNIQRPETRCKVTPLHISTAHGTGRGWVVELLYGLLGHWNCKKTKMDVLSGESSAGAYQEYLDKSLLCCVEEVKESSKRYEISDKLRDTLTEKYLEVNIKHGSKGSIAVYTNFFFMSNHRDALILTEKDRRIQVLSGPETPKNSAYYDKLYDWLNRANIGALAAWLGDRDISAFDWQRSAETAGRQGMIGSSRTPTETAFWDFVKKVGRTAISKKQLDKILLDFMEGDAFEVIVDEHQTLKILQKYFKQSKQIRFNGQRVRPWLIGDWPKSDADEIKQFLTENEKE